MSTAPGLPLTPEAQAYAWRELARRAGLAPQPDSIHGFEALGLDVRYCHPHEDDRPGPALYIPPCLPTAWDELLTLPPDRLAWLPIQDCLPPSVVSPLLEDLPRLFPSRSTSGAQPFAEILPGGRLVFSIDLLAAVVFFLSRWEEQAVPARDIYGRFPASAGVAARLGLLDRPLVDEYALVLRAWLQQLFPGWQPQARRFTVSLSHDIDVLSLPFPKAVELLATDIKKRRPFGLIKSTLRDLLDPYGVDPYLGGIDTLVDLSHQYDLKGTFFFQAAHHSRYDDGYSVQSALARRVFHRLESEGFEIGLHPGYAALDRPDEVRAEKARLDAQLTRPTRAVRQHFLRIRLPETWRIFAAAGFQYDASLTFTDQEGFRSGSCHPYPVFDLPANRQLDLEERPLIVMDVTLHQYRGLAPTQAVERILQLARRCQRVGGDFTFLWHNSSFWREWKDWQQVNFTVLPQLKQLQETA